MDLTRRDFLKSATAAALASPLAPVEEQILPLGLRLARSGASATVPTLCSLCRYRCPLLVHLERGRVVAVGGNPAFRATGGRCCAKATAAVRYLGHPRRLRRPLRRVGDRGSDRWEPISWDEAVDTIAGRLQEVAPPAAGTTPAADGAPAANDEILLFAGGPSSRYITELWQRLAGRVLASSAFCADTATPPVTLLHLPAVQPGTLVVLGGHLGENLAPAILRQVLAWQEAGTRLVVVDPRFSTLAARADTHLMLRPGTDTALLLGWCRQLLEGGGPAAPGLAEAVAPFTLERVARLTGLPAGAIEAVGRELAGGGIVRTGLFTFWYAHDHQRLAAVALVNDLCQGRPVQPLPMPAVVPPSTIPRQARIIGIWGQNPCHALPDPYRTIRACKEADFVFACDLMPTEATLWADIVLPEAFFLERTDTWQVFHDDRDGLLLGLPFAAADPAGDCRDPYWIVQQLAARLGRTEGFEAGSVLGRLEGELRAMGTSVGAVWQGRGLARCSRPPAGEATAAPGAGGGWPRFQPVGEPPPGYARLLAGRDPVHTGVLTLENDWLAAESRENRLWLNDRVAAMLRLADGEAVFLENQDGRRSFFPVRLLVTPGIRPDCVYLAHGFGCFAPAMQEAYGRGVSDTVLLSRSGRQRYPGLRNDFVRLVKDGRVLEIPMLERPPAELAQSEAHR